MAKRGKANLQRGRPGQEKQEEDDYQPGEREARQPLGLQGEASGIDLKTTRGKEGNELMVHKRSDIGNGPGPNVKGF